MCDFYYCYFFFFALWEPHAPFKTKNLCPFVSHRVSTCLNASLTFAVLVRLREVVLVPAGQRRISRVVVGGVLAVISPQRALRPPFLHGVHLALLQCWPVREEVIAIQIFQTQKQTFAHHLLNFILMDSQFAEIHVLSSNTVVVATPPQHCTHPAQSSKSTYSFLIDHSFKAITQHVSNHPLVTFGFTSQTCQHSPRALLWWWIDWLPLSIQILSSEIRWSRSLNILGTKCFFSFFLNLWHFLEVTPWMHTYV